jgi:hypothetical protein
LYTPPAEEIRKNKNKGEQKMNKSIKHIALVLLSLATVMALCFSMISCEGGYPGTTGSGSTVPGIVTSDVTGAGLSSTGATGGTEGSTGAQMGVTTGGTTPVVTPPATGAYINPLTGLRTDYDSSGLRPIAVVVDNISAAYAHQKGLMQADIIYETLVSPGITRFTAIISNYSALSDICNIREAYVEYTDIVGSHNAILVAHGGASHGDFVSVAASRLGGGWSESLGKNTYGYINTSADVAFTVEGGAKYGTIKYYSKIRAEFMESTLGGGLKAHYYSDGYSRADLGGENGYDTILNTSGLMAIFDAKNSSFNQSGATKNGNAKGFGFVSEGMAKAMNGSPAASVSLAMTATNARSTKSVSFNYNSAKNAYFRSQDGTAHKDAATGEQLSFTNVIVLFTDVTCTELKGGANVCTTKVTGEGTGYYFYGGEAIEIRWSKSAWNGELTFTDTAGGALALARGTTYIGYARYTETAVTFN